MLTTEQIRTLNDARTILRDTKCPRTWEGGFAQSTYYDAEKAVFQALNVTRSYLGQTIPDTLMHNREDVDISRSLGRADNVEVIGDEDGFELHIETESGNYVVNVHGCATQLLEQVKQIGDWFAGGMAAAAAYAPPVDPDGYDRSDPKHPDWHSVHADLYDSREGK